MVEPLFLFDLDGTLVDSAPDFLHLCNGLRSELQLQPLQPQQLQPLVNSGARAMVARALDLSPETSPHTDNEASRCQQATQDFLDKYAAIAGQYARVYPGLSALVARLQQTHCRWGVVTNKHRRFAEPLLARLDLTPDVLVCGDDVSHPKPDPESLLMACQRTGANPAATCYAGDHARDMAAAKAAGCLAIAACYGYLEPQENPAHWRADYRVDNSQQLAELMWRLATQEWTPL